MTPEGGRWGDLTARLASGGIVAAVGLGLVWIGGFTFHLLVCAVAAIMLWELARMLGAGPEANWLASGAGVALLVAGELPPGLALPLMFLPALFAAGQIEKNRTIFAVYSVMIMLAGYGLMGLRDDFGFIWMLWLALIVIGSDIAGYFAGRLIGGPKFWPRISPKKTWAGTVAGWIAAAAIALVFMRLTGAGVELVGLSIAIAMAGQFGDIAESAVKRKCAVKDSSSLIPGHGGLFDRFDAMLGASVFLLLVERLVDFPPQPLL
ncbi:MAG: phosphatidate cytidylyltransferase [Pseudomonadota bacterium]